MKKINGKGLKGSIIAILGLSFRADIADTRNSPSCEVIDLLLKRGVSEIRAYDPYVTQDINLEKKGVQVGSSISEATEAADLILIMMSHSSFKKDLRPSELLESASAKTAIIDGRNILHVDITVKDASGPFKKRAEGLEIFVKLARA